MSRNIIQSIPFSKDTVPRRLFCIVFLSYVLHRLRFCIPTLFHFPGKLVSFCMLGNVSGKPTSKGIEMDFNSSFQRDENTIIYAPNKQVLKDASKCHAFFTFWQIVHNTGL